MLKDIPEFTRKDLVTRQVGGPLEVLETVQNCFKVDVEGKRIAP